MASAGTGAADIPVGEVPADMETAVVVLIAGEPIVEGPVAEIPVVEDLVVEGPAAG